MSAHSQVIAGKIRLSDPKSDLFSATTHVRKWFQSNCSLNMNYIHVPGLGFFFRLHTKPVLRNNRQTQKSPTLVYGARFFQPKGCDMID